MDELATVNQNGWTLPAVLICILSLSTLAATVSLVTLRTVKMQQVVAADSGAQRELSRRLVNSTDPVGFATCSEVSIRTPLAPWRRLLCREAARIFNVSGSLSTRELVVDWDFLERQMTHCAGIREALSQLVFSRPLAPSTCKLRGGTYSSLVHKDNIFASEPITARSTNGSLITIASPGTIALARLSLDTDAVVVSGGDMVISQIEAITNARCITLISADGDIKVSSTSRSTTSRSLYLTALGRHEIIIPSTALNGSHCKQPPTRSVSFRGLSRD